jgi:hypothetical protein
MKRFIPRLVSGPQNPAQPHNPAKPYAQTASETLPRSTTLLPPQRRARDPQPARLTRLDPAVLDPASRTFLTLLTQEGARARDGIVSGMVSVIGRSKSGVSLALGQAPLLLADRLCRQLWLKRDHHAGRVDYVLTPLAQQILQAQTASTRLPAQTESAPSPRTNPKESPLMWLARRRNSRGQTHISATQLMAGERLRRDFTLAGMTPAMTANWSGLPVATSKSTTRLNESERMLEARQRLRNALAACEKGEADLLLDLCCFLKPLEAVERAYGFRARTGKHLLARALTRLAHHYGLQEHAQGKAKATAIRVWKA